MVTQKTPSAEECGDSPVQRAQSSEMEEEVHLFHHTGIHKYAQSITSVLLCA